MARVGGEFHKGKKGYDNHMRLPKYNDNAKINANISQIRDFGSSQFLQWRIVTLLSIKKILLNIDDFVDDNLLTIFPKDVDRVNLRYNQIRNGFIYEAVSQSIQGIEEMFAMINGSKKLKQFTQKHIKYQASKISSYIKKPQWDKESFVLDELKLPLLEEKDCDSETYDLYRSGVEILLKNIIEIRAFYIRYVKAYNQYKHGLKVGMRPYGHDIVNHEAIDIIRQHPLDGTLHIFTNDLSGDLKGINFSPAVSINMTQYTHLFLNEMQNRKELLAIMLDHFNIQNAIDVVTKAATITSVVWSNIEYRITAYEKKESTKQYAFPTNHPFRQMIVTIVGENAYADDFTTF